MADSNHVPDALMADLNEQFSDPELVELTFLIGYINMLNLFNNASASATTASTRCSGRRWRPHRKRALTSGYLAARGIRFCVRASARGDAAL